MVVSRSPSFDDDLPPIGSPLFLGVGNPPLGENFCMDGDAPFTRSGLDACFPKSPLYFEPLGGNI